MGQGTEELTREIQDTRDELAHDLDALQDKVSPSAIVERRKAAARDRLHGVRSRVMGTATSVGSAGGNVGGQASNAASNVADAAEQRFEGSPLAAGLVAFGAGLVIASLVPATRQEAEVASRLVDAAEPMVDQARAVGQDIASAAAENAQHAVQEVKDTAGGSAARMQQEGRSSAQSVKDEATS